MSRNRRQYHYLIKNTTRKRRKPRTIKPLPIPEEHKHDDLRGLFHYFSITQEETADVFTVSVENRYNSLFEILVGGDNLHGCIIINISDRLPKSRSALGSIFECRIYRIPKYNKRRIQRSQNSCTYAHRNQFRIHTFQYCPIHIERY